MNTSAREEVSQFAHTLPVKTPTNIAGTSQRIDLATRAWEPALPARMHFAQPLSIASLTRSADLRSWRGARKPRGQFREIRCRRQQGGIACGRPSTSAQAFRYSSAREQSPICYYRGWDTEGVTDQLTFCSPRPKKQTPRFRDRRLKKLFGVSGTMPISAVRRCQSWRQLLRFGTLRGEFRTQPADDTICPERLCLRRGILIPGYPCSLGNRACDLVFCQPGRDRVA